MLPYVLHKLKMSMFTTNGEFSFKAIRFPWNTLYYETVFPCVAQVYFIFMHSLN